ncbi:WD40 repeat domain-containing protein [Aporhodopirellula aestuarii]|uniref:Uncharacterized protein n=1 Tax=Aporhodopirellula aestuarii TaxID=2950107 RepID=A0ABT0UDT1_9BACT|nr:hypothetical protein [Aporhodopirellula aestuarii]MCM2374889.1 hypothetical protein [Aporhodopirellula aestuarii]
MGKMNRCAIGVLLLINLIFCPFGFAEEDEWRDPRLLPARPQVQIDSQKYFASPGEEKAILALVDRLSEIDQPDFGFANWMSGSQFAPLPQSDKFYSGIIMIDHQLKTNDVLRQLVALGPKALPILLQRLSDPTPTKLEMEHQGMMGSQWYGREVSLNVARPVEREVKKRFADLFAKEEAFGVGENVPKHVMTIGDICFVIIGQIVNRGYQASRYQPTACRVINSPTHDPEIAEVVRAIWESEDSPQLLWDALLDDLFTDHRGYGQDSAALRLLFYFPDRSSGIIANRIRDLDLTDPSGAGSWQEIQAKNGLDAIEFLEAVRSSDQPLVTDALLDAAKRSETAYYLAASLNANVARADEDAIIEQMRKMLSVAPPVDQGPFGGEKDLLSAAARYYPAQSQELFGLYRNHYTMETLRSCIHALRHPTKQQVWMKEFLASLLDDKTDTGWRYGPDYDRQPIRICDEAAEILATDYLAITAFRYENNPAFMDGQIAKLKRVLSGDKSISFAAAIPPNRPADFPTRKALHTLYLEEHLWPIYSISDRDSIWADGFNESVQIDCQSGEVIQRVPIELPEGNESYVAGGISGRSFSYYGDDGGKLIQRDVRTGRVITNVKTPFHDGVQFDDAVQIRNLGDVTICGVESEWLIACTSDGALHRVSTASGEHRVEHQFPTSKRGMFLSPELLASPRSSKVLIEGLGEDAPFDTTLYLWDQAREKLQTIEKAPSMGWSAFWGTLALNSMNGYCTVWNLDTVQEVELPWRDEPIVSVAANADQSILYLLRNNGAIDVVRVDDGSAVVPLRRLAPAVDSPVRGSLVVCDDGQHLLWHARIDETEQAGVPESTKLVIAVYDTGENPKQTP